MFVGYMDESYDGSPVPKVFNLSCLITNILGWVYFEWDWLKVLEDKNRELRSQGRKELSRFHAKDINNFQGEYEKWTADERLEFCTKLTAVFKRNPLHIHGWGMPLQILVEEIPETRPNPVGVAYVVLLRELMQQMGKTTLSLPNYQGDLISLYHDRCKYDASLFEGFNLMLEDESFRFRKRFVSVTPEGWEHCVPLQAADLIAYENFKEEMRYHIKDSKEAQRNRVRKSLEAIINLDSISGRARTYTRDMIRELKQTLDESPETKQAIFKAARI